MGSTVFIIRECTHQNECIDIYGVYSDLKKAINNLLQSEQDLIFDDVRWIWSKGSGRNYFRIDEYTVE